MQVDRILVGTDFSEASVDAAAWTVRNLAAGAEIVLAHVLDVPRPPGFLPASAKHERVVESARAGAQRRLEELASSLAHETASEIRIRIESGRAADRLLEIARDERVDIIAVGEHGRGAGVLDVLGSTAQRLVQCANVPVLVARAATDSPPRRVLAAIDDSEHAIRVLGWARTVAAAHDARLDVMHVVTPMYRGVVDIVSGTAQAERIAEDYEDQAAEWLRQQLVRADIEPDRAGAHIRTGGAQEEIVAEQRREDADLIVLGSRGAGTVGRAFLGSVANSVLRAADCSVLVVREDGC